MRKKWKSFEWTAADEFLHPVAEIALADPGNGSVDGDNERGKPSDAGAFNRGLSGAAAAHQIQLIEDGAGRGGFYIFESVPGHGGENVGGASFAGGARRTHFAHGMHEPAVANGSEQEGKSEIEAKNARAQVAIGERDRVSGTEGDVLIDAAIFAEGNLAFGATIKVIEDGFGYAPLGDGSEISDADYARRGDGTGRSSHFCFYTKAGSSFTEISFLTLRTAAIVSPNSVRVHMTEPFVPTCPAVQNPETATDVLTDSFRLVVRLVAPKYLVFVRKGRRQNCPNGRVASHPAASRVHPCDAAPGQRCLPEGLFPANEGNTWSMSS